MKVCNICKRTQPISEFSNNRSAKDGLMNRCNECNRKIVNRYYNAKCGTAEERKRKRTTLQERIEYLRSQGYTLKQIAIDVGLDTSSISYYLRGKRRVGMSAVRKYEKRSRES